MYTELIIGEQTYKLRLSIKNCIQLEKQLGCNPIQLLWDIDENKLPKITDIVVILQSMLQQYHHNINLDKTYDLIEQYIADGHKLFDIIPVFVDVFKDCGLIDKQEEADA